jgi:hypothetical protein
VEVIPVPESDDELLLPPEPVPPLPESALAKLAAKERSGPLPVPEPVFPLAASQPPAVPPPSLPIPSPPTIDVPVEVRSQEIIVTIGDRRYRVRGFSKNLSYDLMKVNLLASHGEGFHVDTLNLYTAHQRTAFIKQAAVEMGVKEEVIRHDLGQVLLKLEELQDQQIQKTLETKKPEVAISDEDRTAALDLLNDPHLLERMLADFTRCGVVGEETNKKVAYLAAVSRLLDTPLAIIIQSSSAAGKSSLMEAVLALMPEEQRVQYSAMTGQSLFYMGETDLKNKILAIVEEEGAQRAAYALKLLQSEGSLTIASTGKDPATGKLITHQYRVEGPVMIFLTTTAIEIDEELLNRCLVLTVDEDREQTRAIHRIQRTAQTLAGLLAKRGRQDIVALHRNAQRLLKPIAVVNPYADRLTFPDSLTRTRRDHMKFLVLIRAITLLHQYQRPVKTTVCGGKPLEYIESTEADVELAEELITQVLGRSLDELPPQTRRLLLLVDEMVSRECESHKMQRGDYRFSRRDVRHATSWSDAQLKRHLHKLEEMEYLVVHRGGRGQSFVYELYFERPADPGKPFLPGLVEIGKLRGHGYDEKKYGPNGEKDGACTAQVRPVSEAGADAPGSINTGVSGDPERILPKRADTGEGPESAIDVPAKRKR